MSGSRPIQLDELVKIQSYYLMLKCMASELCEFEDRHLLAKEMKDRLDKVICTLDYLSHELINDVFIMRMENFKNGKTKTDSDNCSM